MGTYKFKNTCRDFKGLLHNFKTINLTAMTSYQTVSKIFLVKGTQ